MHYLVLSHSMRVTDGRTDGQNYDFQDRTIIAASRGKKRSLLCAINVKSIGLERYRRPVTPSYLVMAVLLTAVVFYTTLVHITRIGCNNSFTRALSETALTDMYVN